MNVEKIIFINMNLIINVILNVQREQKAIKIINAQILVVVIFIIIIKRNV